MRIRFPLGLGLLVVATPAIAQVPARDPAAAEALFRQGRQALALGDYASACPRFAESQRLDPAVGTLMNVAECEEHFGQLAASWESWHEALDQLLRTGDERIELARVHADDLDKRVPRIAIRLAPGITDARVTRDGVSLSAASLGVALPVDSGAHRVVLTAPGRAPAEQVVTLAEGERVDIVLEAGPLLPIRHDAPDAATSAGGAAGNPWRTTGFVALGVGGASLVTAVVSGILVAHDRGVVDSSCNAAKGCSPDGANAASAGKTWLAVNTIASIATVATAGLGVALVLTHPAPRFAISVAPTAATVGLTGAF